MPTYPTYTPVELIKGLYGGVGKVRLMCWILWEATPDFTASDIMHTHKVLGSDANHILPYLEALGAITRAEQHKRGKGAKVYLRADSPFWDHVLWILGTQQITSENWREKLPRSFAQ